jgi:chemotaxis protein methyltransferase CheR
VCSARWAGKLAKVDAEQDDPQQAWDQRYGESQRVWSGGVNPRLVEVASTLEPGRALDLGCGEGADAVWLAERGWHVAAVDVSPIALQRAADAASERNLSDRIDFEHHDLPETFPEGAFDLVSAQYLHSPARLDRETVLRIAAGRVTPQGVLLIVDHEAPPPWAPHHDEKFPGGEEVLASLRLDESQWQRLRLDTVDRELTGPDGQTATVGDNVIALRRVP